MDILFHIEVIATQCQPTLCQLKNLHYLLRSVTYSVRLVKSMQLERKYHNGF